MYSADSVWGQQRENLIKEWGACKIWLNSCKNKSVETSIRHQKNAAGDETQIRYRMMYFFEHDSPQG
jgi:hypothetical protein